MPRFIDNYDVILLDMGKTFMFQCDRFEDLDALQASYEDLGGTLLSDGRAGRAAKGAFDWGMRLYRAEQRRDRFPSAREMLQQVPEAASMSEDEMQRLVDVMAVHEAGTIPSSHVQALRELRRTHRLGLVSNVFSPSDVFRKAFDHAGISRLFDVLAWSSDVGVCKPCPGIFEHALKAFGPVPLGRIVHVGDSFKSDVGGARNVGIGAVWISQDPTPPDGEACRPDLVIKDLRELLQREAF